jgi:hypothetical protein
MKNLLTFFLLCLVLTFNFLHGDEKLSKKARPFLVQVEFEVLKNESPFIDDNNFGEFETYFENKKKYLTYGIPITENTIAINHFSLAPDRFKNIKIKTADGKEFSAELDSYGINRDLQTIKIDGKLSPVIWKSFDADKSSGSLYATTLAFREIYPYITMKEITNELEIIPFFENEKDIYPLETFDSPRTISALINKKGEPIAMQTGNYYKIKDKTSMFTSKDITKISLDEIKTKEDLIVSKLHKEIFFVHIYFRQKLNANEYNMDENTSFADSSPEAKIMGILINDKGDILLPYDIPLEKIKDIEKIEIQTPEKIFQATFKGAYATIGASLINCAELKGLLPKIEWNHLGEEELVFAFSLIWNSPEDYQFEIILNRLDSHLYGIDDRITYNLKHVLNNFQAIFFNSELNICGINSKFKNIEDLNNDSDGSYQSGSDSLSFLYLSDIKTEIMAPEKYLDNRAMQQNRQEALTPTWLGVNVQSPSVAMIEHLKALDKTKNGTLGFLVTQVYANSPAQKIGLKQLDILLSVTYDDSDREFEFVKNSEYSSSLYSDNGQALPTFWFFPSCKNEVTNVLSKLETGKTVILKYIRDGKLLTAPFVLEKAPKDYSNADKYVDDDFGLHVKDITYEVRDSLKLKEGENGVIISEVEQGKAADIAKLQLYFIVLKVDNTPILSVESFKQLITSKKIAGTTEFSFTILYLGKTSIIKINLKS